MMLTTTSIMAMMLLPLLLLVITLTFGIATAENRNSRESIDGKICCLSPPCCVTVRRNRMGCAADRVVARGERAG